MRGEPVMIKEAFLELAQQLGLTGSEERLDALYEEVRAALVQTAAVHGVDTTGVEPCGTSPWQEGGAG